MIMSDAVAISIMCIYDTDTETPLVAWIIVLMAVGIIESPAWIIKLLNLIDN